MPRRGELAVAILRAAEAHGPGTVRELCARSQVAFVAGNYTATRLLQRGDLVVVARSRPVVLGMPTVR